MKINKYDILGIFGIIMIPLGIISMKIELTIGGIFILFITGILKIDAKMVRKK